MRASCFYLGIMERQFLSAFSEEEIEYLKKIYALVEDDDALVDILHHQSMSRLYSKKTMVLTIAPTQSCNFACTYCFEKWRQSGALSNRTEDANYKLYQASKAGGWP